MCRRYAAEVFTGRRFYRPAASTTLDRDSNKEDSANSDNSDNSVNFDNSANSVNSINSRSVRDLPISEQVLPELFVEGLVVPSDPFERHRRVFYLFIAVVLENLL